MSAFGMQVGCACDIDNAPAAMECIEIWDGPDTEGGMVAGRRYVWECLVCEHRVCINMKLVEDES